MPQISVFRLFYAILLSVNLDLFARKNAIIAKTSNVSVGTLFHSHSSLLHSRHSFVFVPVFSCLITFIHVNDDRPMFDEHTCTLILQIDSYL